MPTYANLKSVAMRKKRVIAKRRKRKSTEEKRFERLADFLNEAGMLRKTPRSGYAFLGSGKENVAEHSFRTTVIGHALAQMLGVNVEKTLLLCLYHDLHEARTGDFNYVNHRYNSCDARAALRDAAAGSGLESEILALWDELEAGETLEAKIARDADQLDLICNLQMERRKGNREAEAWLKSALPRLKIAESKKLAHAILNVSPDNWWKRDVAAAWWINHADPCDAGKNEWLAGAGRANSKGKQYETKGVRLQALPDVFRLVKKICMD